jgi:phosphoribosylanthranilate isomerase
MAKRNSVDTAVSQISVSGLVLNSNESKRKIIPSQAKKVVKKVPSGSATRKTSPKFAKSSEIKKKKPRAESAD